MALNHGKTIESLEGICKKVDRDEFIYSFLRAYDFPKSTITRLRNQNDDRNLADGGDVALKRKLYFKPVKRCTDDELEAAAQSVKELPLIARNDIRFIIVTDYRSLVALDLTANEHLLIPLSELPRQYAFFLPLAGFEKAIMYSEHPADVQASEKMGQLFDLIRSQNDISKPADIHALNVFLTRLLFCFYAEDTGIFKKGQMTQAVQSITQADGSDVSKFFSDLFQALNLEAKSPKRKKMPAHFQAFPYVNGGLFRDDTPVPGFGAKARRILIECGTLDWSQINPDIFGSMFQAVIDQKKRANLGQHYTSVSNIMKVIQPLFLDKLYADLKKSRKSEKKLKSLLLRLQNLRIFDPACGSGNFLIIAYKELRKVEMEVINALNALGSQSEIYYSGIHLSQFFGIEMDDFAHEVAILSLWLAEHQMNLEFKKNFGYAEATLPLQESGHIVCGNSLRLDWEEVCPLTDGNGVEYEVYLCGNPPFLGTTERSAEQSADMKQVFSFFKSIGYLDIVAAWFWKGANYIAGNKAKCAFVSTNSICQGDQTSLLWPPIFDLDLSIDFCFQTFTWSNNAKNKAAVHVVIIGIKNSDDTSTKPRIFQASEGKVISSEVENISPYLTAGPDLAVFPHTKPLEGNSPMIKGSQATDGGHFYVTPSEREAFIRKYPQHSHWIRRILGAKEFLNGGERWCFWLADIPLKEAMKVPEVALRCEKIRELRIKAGHPAALRAAERPHTFIQIAQPSSGNYLLVPRVSSERRPYVPMGFFGTKIISSDANQMVPEATLYEFGILTSEMHNDWMRTVAGRLKSDYRYSATLVYNTFPWPTANAKQKKHIESLAEEVLLIREDYPTKTLSDLYDPDKMPAPLLKAHKALDKAVEALYRDKPFRDATERLEHLFAKYEVLTRQS